MPNQYIIELLLETAISTRSVQSGCKEDNWDDTVNSACVEAGSNTSSVALRVIGGDENASLKSERVKYGHESHGTRTQE
jgi:hypothetical protein